MSEKQMKMWDPAEESKYKVNGIMLNLDNTAHGVTGKITEEGIIAWANQFKGTHITDVVMNISEGCCVFPTKKYVWYGEKYLLKEENGYPVNYSGGLAQNLYEHFVVNKMDYLKTLSKALPEAGINMWLSMRMNDSHSRELKTSLLFTEFFHAHPEYRRTHYKSKIDRLNDNLFDYGHEEVRELYLGLMDEALDRYDVYGFQLEWHRNIKLWKIGYEYVSTEILNQFMRDAKAIITKYEKKYGHKIKLSVQVAQDIETNYEYGLDVMKRVSEGLVDMVVPKGRFITTYNEMPVKLWKSLLASYNVELVPDIEHHVQCRASGKRWVEIAANEHDIETYAGTAGVYFSQGADKVQVYNLLVPMYHVFKEEDKIAEYDTTIRMPEFVGGDTTSVRGWWLVFSTIGSYEKLMTMKRKVLLTFKDELPIWERYNDAWLKCGDKLPVTIKTGDSVCALRIAMGDIPAGGTATLKFSSSNIDAENPPIVFVNSEECRFIGVEDSPNPVRTKNQLYRFEIPEKVHGNMYAVAEIQSPNIKGSDEIKMEITIDYAEVYIVPAENK